MLPPYSTSCCFWRTTMTSLVPFILIQHAYFFRNTSTSTLNSTEIPCVTESQPQSTPVPIPEPEVKECKIKYTPGNGTIKVHTEPKKWSEARRICHEEGGHLAIINSASEAQAIGELLRKSSIAHAYIGYHDLFKKGEFVTVYGEPLSETGFLDWSPGEPHAMQECGGICPDDKLCDITSCETLLPFVCELPNSA